MLEPGEAIDIWIVEAALGSGGMGSVYRCHNRTATRIMAAIKVLEGGLRRYPEAEARFIREAEILFQLDHPNIVKVRNVRTDSEPPYLEMEFVAGESLDERLRRGPLPYPEAVGFMRQCADALAYLHDKGIRHRDIKPANLLVQKEGRIKLVDFGLAVEQDHTRITQAGMAFGTVSYAPPEWVAPDTLDPVMWDIYALGVVFYEMLTGQLAFPVSGAGTARQQAMQVIVAKQNHPPLDPGPSFHDDVRALIADMTRSDAAARVPESKLLVPRTRDLLPTLRGAAGVTLAPSRLDVPADTANVDDTPPPAPSAAGPAAKAPAAVPAAAVRAAPKPVPSSDRPRAAGMALAAFGGLGALLVAGGLFALVGAAGLWLYATSGTAARPVALRIEGAPDGVPVDVTVAGLVPATADGRRLSFAEVPRGDAPVRWAAGSGCTVALCPGEHCPEWCTHGLVTFAVAAGDGAQEVALAVLTAAPRDATVRLPGLDGSDVAVRATLAGREGVRTASGVAFTEVPPGDWKLELTAGSCPSEASGCWPLACPPGCSSAVAQVVVPITGPPIPAEADLGPPVAPAPVAAVPKPGPATSPRPSGARGLVTVGDLAAWLPQNPDYAPGGAFAVKGGSGYLRGWTAAGPPEGRKSGEPVTGVSAALAIEFCKKRGGLPGIEAGPDVPSTAYEIRVDGSQVRLLENLGDGTTRAVPTDAVRATSGASFRCAR